MPRLQAFLRLGARGDVSERYPGEVEADNAVSALVLPSPSAVWDRMRQLEESGDLWADLRISIERIAIGFGLATVMAVPLGVLMGSFGVWEAALEPLVDFVRYMPVVGFIPLTIFWVGLRSSKAPASCTRSRM